MKRIFKIVGKVVLVVILLFLCLCSKPVNAAENQETAEKFSAIKQAIEDELERQLELELEKVLRKDDPNE